VCKIVGGGRGQKAGGGGWKDVALVDAVMASFAKFDFTFKLSKTELYKSELDFLGHRLTQQGLTRQEAKVDAIRKWAAPTTQRSRGPVTRVTCHGNQDSLRLVPARAVACRA